MNLNSSLGVHKAIIHDENRVCETANVVGFEKWNIKSRAF
jgi:hypothetical protein